MPAACIVSIARPFQYSWATVKIETLNYCETLVLISSYHFYRRYVFELCNLHPPRCYNSSLAFRKGIHCRVFSHSSKSLFTNPITRLFKAWDTDLLSSLAYRYGPYSLNSLCFSMTAHRGLSSAFFFYLLTPIDFRHSSYSPTTLILVFLLFFYHLVFPEILSFIGHSYLMTNTPSLNCSSCYNIWLVFFT